MLYYIVYLIAILFAICVLLSLYFRLSYGGRMICKIPGPKPDFIFGNMFDIVLKPDNLFIFTRSLSQYGRLSKVYAFHFKAVNVYHPHDVEILMSSVKFNDKEKPYTFLTPWLGNGLLVSNGDKWFQRRKLLTPAFHFNILKKFCRTFIEQTEELVGDLQRETSAQKTLVQPLIMKHTLRIMCETSMGCSMDEDIRCVSNKYLNAIYLMGECFIYRLSRVWLYADQAFKASRGGKIQEVALRDLHKFTKQIIQERREYRKVNQVETVGGDDAFMGKKLRLAMLDLLLDQEKRGMIDDDGIREEVDTFMFEGHDTTATALTFMMMRIANEPEIQDKIYDELYGIFGTSTRPPGVEDLAEMKYLECCIKESLRLYPSVPFIARVIKEDVVLSGYTVPPGTVCNIHIYDIHRNPAIYPDPERFIPERFLPENVANRHPYAYIPFSAGSRNCIGQKFAMMELKTVMSGVLRQYRLEPVTRPQDLVFTSDIVLRCKTPIYITIKKR